MGTLGGLPSETAQARSSPLPLLASRIMGAAILDHKVGVMSSRAERCEALKLKYHIIPGLLCDRERNFHLLKATLLLFSWSFVPKHNPNGYQGAEWMMVGFQGQKGPGGLGLLKKAVCVRLTQSCPTDDVLEEEQAMVHVLKGLTVPQERQTSNICSQGRGHQPTSGSPCHVSGQLHGCRFNIHVHPEVATVSIIPLLRGKLRLMGVKPFRDGR